MNGFARSTYGGWTRGQVAGMPVGEYLWDRANITNPAISVAERTALRRQAKEELAAIKANAAMYKELKRMTSTRRTFPRYMALTPAQRYARFARFNSADVPYAPESAWGAYPAAYPYMSTTPYMGMEFAKPDNRDVLIGQYARLMSEVRKASGTKMRSGEFTRATAAQLRAQGAKTLAQQIVMLQSLLSGAVPETPQAVALPPTPRRSRVANMEDQEGETLMVPA